MPGLINAHTHLAMNIFRGLADDLEFMDWLQNHIWPAEGKIVSHDMVYDGSLFAITELIKGGTTCFSDMYFYPGATLDAAKLAGIRAHVGLTVIEAPTAWAKNADEYLAKAKEFYDQYKEQKLMQLTMAPHSTYALSNEYLIKCNEFARERNLKISMHLQEAPSDIEHSMTNYGKRPLARLADIDMLSSSLIGIHMTQVIDEDIQMMSDAKVNIVNCPESNMKLVCGASPVEKMTKAGINVALGTDGAASNNDLDMIGEMRTAALLGKFIANDPKAVSADLALKMATINGAKALGIDRVTGSLTAGKSADFIAIDMDNIESQPLYHVVSQIVYSSSRYQVTDTWVAGRQLMKNRKLQTIDEKELIEKAQLWREKIV